MKFDFVQELVYQIHSWLKFQVNLLEEMHNNFTFCLLACSPNQGVGEISGIIKVT
jgi:hypothetical protein